MIDPICLPPLEGPTCDYLSITVPSDHSHGVRMQLASLLLGIGAESAYGESYRIWGGFLGVKALGKDRQLFHASGRVLAALRVNGKLGHYLGIFSEVPHRVTKIDIAYDVPTSAPPALKRLKRKAYKGVLQLTRKKIPSSAVRFISGLNSDGVETGTLYLGSRKAEVHCRVYDKCHEQFEKQKVIVDPCLRYEVTITDKVGASLKVAESPAGAFWHYMRHILPVPSNAPTWVPMAQEGYTIAKHPEGDAPALICRLLETSPLIKDLGLLAESLGPEGVTYLVRKLTETLAHQSSERRGQVLERSVSTNAEVVQGAVCAQGGK